MEHAVGIIGRATLVAGQPEVYDTFFRTCVSCALAGCGAARVVVVGGGGGGGAGGGVCARVRVCVCVCLCVCVCDRRVRAGWRRKS
jgi:hypothetical protein